MDTSSTDQLTAWIQSFYSDAIVNDQTQQASVKQLQGAAYDSRLDANHPLQLWAKRISDAILGPDTKTTTTTSTNEKWAKWVPIVLLAGAVYLIFYE